jgi:hypothetical protein
LLTDLLFPDLRAAPYLGRIGLVLTGIWYVLGASLLALLTRFSIAPGYRAPPVLLAATAVLALLLAVIALVVLPRTAGRPVVDASAAPQPWIVLLVTCIASLIWHTLLALLWRIQPALAGWPLVLIPMLSAGAVLVATAWLIRKWAATRDWNDRHQLALVSGAAISHSLFGGAILTKTTVDRLGVAGLGLVLIVLLILLAIRIRGRVEAQSRDAP